MGFLILALLQAPVDPAFHRAGALPAAVKMKIVLHRVDFEGDTTVVLPAALPILQEAALVARDTGTGAIIVIVDQPTDSRRSATYRSILTRRRAKAVRHFLVSQGIAATRITIPGLNPPSLSFANNRSNRPAELYIQ
jgi:outer membrane protein OmpA-like peptidoglycan-associated protein